MESFTFYESKEKLFASIDSNLLRFESFSFDFKLRLSNHVIALNGVITNLYHLKKIYAARSTCHLFEILYSKYGSRLGNVLRGKFQIFIYDRATMQIHLIVDHNCTKPIFYTNTTDFFAFGDNFYELCQLLANNGKLNDLNTETLHFFATYGYCPGKNTFIKGVNKLQAGSFVTIGISEIILDTYHRFEHKPIEISFEHSVSMLEEYFINATRQHFEIDRNLGKAHIGSLSGGLDSRMTLLSGKKSGYQEITAFTFSTPGYWDAIIAKKISRTYDFEHLLFPLDNAAHLDDYETVFKSTSGLVVYHLIAQLPKFINQIPFENFGLFHTGQIGDAIVGNSLFPFTTHSKSGTIHGYQKGVSKCAQDVWSREVSAYETFEEAMFHNQVRNGAFNGDWVMSEVTESVSPFLNVEVMEHCLSLPLEYRNKHRLYYAWIKKFYADSGKFYYEKTKKRTIPSDTFSVKTLRRIENRINLIRMQRAGLDKNAHNLLGTGMLEAHFEKMNFKTTILESFDLFDKHLIKMLQDSLNSSNIHWKLLSYHLARTVAKYQSLINNQIHE